MANENQAKDKISLSVIFSQAYSLYRENFFLFIGIISIGFTLWFLKIFLAILSVYVFAGLVSIFAPFISIWASAALIIAVSAIYKGNQISFVESFAKIKGQYWSFVWISILYQLIVIAGLLLLIIPGIYLATIFSLGAIVVVLEKKTATGALRISKELVKENFWNVFFLGLIMIAFASPLYFIFKLTGVNQNMVDLLFCIYFILYQSFLISVGVILCHRLKDKRINLSPQSEATIKGATNCLLASALIIVIIILCAFWLFRITKFLRTEKGAQTWEFVGKITSPEISLPGGVKLERPKGWSVAKTVKPRIKYDLTRFGQRKIYSISLWVIPIKDLKIPQAVISLDSNFLGENIFEETLKNFEEISKEYKAQPSKTIKLNDRQWAECILTKEHFSEKWGRILYTDVWQNFYTILNDYILICSCSYRYHHYASKSEIEFQEDLLRKDKEEVENIMTSIKFP